MYLISMPAGGEWLWIFLVVIVLALLPFIFFLLTMQNTLNQVSPGKRFMEPGQVWLSLIPLFNVVWQFIMVDRMANSIEAEMRSRGMQVTERPAYNIGLAYCICFCATWVPIIGSLGSIAGLICWVIYWVKINEYKTRLVNTPAIYTDNDSSIFDKG